MSHGFKDRDGRSFRACPFTETYLTVCFCKTASLGGMYANSGQAVIPWALLAFAQPRKGELRPGQFGVDRKVCLQRLDASPRNDRGARARDGLQTSDQATGSSAVASKAADPLGCVGRLGRDSRKCRSGSRELTSSDAVHY